MNGIHKLAFSLFGNYVRKKNYFGVRAAIRQAHLGLPWDIYVSTAYFYALLTGILSIAFGLLLTPLWNKIYPYYLNTISKTGITLAAVRGYGEILFAGTVVLFFSLLLASITYYLIIKYPSLVSSIRKQKIDMTLPHAVAYMHAMSKGGLNLLAIFKSLREHTDIYGETAEEIGYILMDTELHGNDLLSAIKNAAVRTQSDKFRDFLENLINAAESSKDLEMFFAHSVDHFQSSAVADQNIYLEMLGMVAETYVTVFVAGPLFLITILIVMGMMGPGSLVTIKLVIYAVIPLSAVLFSVLLSMISLQGDSRRVKIYSVSKKIHQYDDVRTKPISEEDSRFGRRFMRSIRWTSVVKARNNPMKIFFADPFKAFYITAPVSTIYLILSISKKEITIDLLDDAIIISVLILFVPFLFFYEMQNRRIRQIEDSIPSFMRRLAVINDVGMPLAAAIKSIADLNIGVLSTEVKLMYKDITWSHSVTEALMKFERRVNTIAISRIVNLIAKASESTGNIKETLRVAADDASLAEKLRRQKFTTLFSYLVVVYIAFAVFLLVLYVFATMFLPQIPSASSSSYSNTGMLISANIKEYTMLFMHASVIQGFFSGIIAGQMMGESIYDGLKHSMIMIALAYVFFVFLV